MSSPLVWIFFPLIAALILFALQRWQSWVAAAGTLAALGLAGLAWWLPFEEIITLGPWSFKIAEHFIVAGLQFTLTNAVRPMLVLVYAATAFFFGGTLAVRVHRWFVPLGLIVVVVLAAALAVKPILYTALLIEFAVLVSVLILSPPGRPVGRGVLRFLVFQTLGMLFILLAGWLLTGLGAAPEDFKTMMRAALMLGLGFVFLSAICPVYTWIPMLTEETHPYTAAFVFLTILDVAIFLVLKFIELYPWLHESLNIYETLRLMGVLMVATGGAWAAFQRHLGRMLGYAVIIGIGQSLLAISLQNGVALFFVMLLPRILALGVWSLALAVFRSHSSDLRFSAVQGMARRFPIAGAGLLFAHFSLAGLPLLGGFPLSLALWERIAANSPVIALWTLLGSVGLAAGGLRSLAILVMGPDDLPWQGKTGLMARILILAGIFVLFLLGIVPQWFFPLLSDLPVRFGILPP